MTSRPVGASAERLQLEAVAENGVEDDRRAELRDLLVVVGERLGAELAEVVVLRPARGRVDLRAEVAADVDRRLARSARARLHEQALAFLQARVGEACPGGLVGDAERRPRALRRASPGSGGRARVAAATSSAYVPSEPLTSTRSPVSSRVPAPSTPGSEGRRGSGRLGRLALIEVEVVDPRSLEPDEHLPVGRGGVRDLLVLQDFRPAAFVDDDRLHGPPCSRFLRS